MNREPRPFILADNQDITRAGLMFLLGLQHPMPLIVEAGCKQELIAQLQRHPQAAVVLDYTTFDFSSADEVLALHERFKSSVWLLFSDELSLLFLRQMLYGSRRIGVVMKDGTKEEIMEALQQAARGERFVSSHVNSRMLSTAPAPPKPVKETLLTATEQSILKEIALGKTTKEIAAERCLSFHTVNTHRKNIFRKLGVNNAHEATRYAIKAGIVDPVEYYI